MSTNPDIIKVALRIKIKTHFLFIITFVLGLDYAKVNIKEAEGQEYSLTNA